MIFWILSKDYSCECIILYEYHSGHEFFFYPLFPPFFLFYFFAKPMMMRPPVEYVCTV